jgi:hypothetical protein
MDFKCPHYKKRGEMDLERKTECPVIISTKHLNNPAATCMLAGMQMEFKMW